MDTFLINHQGPRPQSVPPHLEQSQKQLPNQPLRKGAGGAKGGLAAQCLGGDASGRLQCHPQALSNEPILRQPSLVTQNIGSVLRIRTVHGPPQQGHPTGEATDEDTKGSHVSGWSPFPHLLYRAHLGAQHPSKAAPSEAVSMAWLPPWGCVESMFWGPSQGCGECVLRICTRWAGGMGGALMSAPNTCGERCPDWDSMAMPHL